MWKRTFLQHYAVACTPHASVASNRTFCGSGRPSSFGMTISLSHHCRGILAHFSVQRFSSLRFVGMLLFIAHLSSCSTSAFRGLDFGQLPHLDSFLFQLYSRRFAALGITILLLHDPNSAKLYFSFRTDGLTFDSRRESCGCKTNPIHYPTTTVLKS